MSPSICWQSWAACNEYTSQWAVARDERTARGSRIRWTTLTWIQIVILFIFVRPCLYVTLGDPRLQILFPDPNCLDHPQIGGLALAWSSHCDIRPLSRPLQSCYFREKLWRTIVETIQGALCWVHCRQRWSIPAKKGQELPPKPTFEIWSKLPEWLKKICRSRVGRYVLSGEGRTSPSVGQQENFHLARLGSGFGRRHKVLHFGNIVQHVFSPLWSVSSLV